MREWARLSSSENVSCVEWFIKHGAAGMVRHAKASNRIYQQNKVDLVDAWHMLLPLTPLQNACVGGHLRLVQCLCKHGAAEDLFVVLPGGQTNLQQKEGLPPLIGFMMEGGKECPDMNRDTKDVSYGDRVLFGQRDIAKWFLQMDNGPSRGLPMEGLPWCKKLFYYELNDYDVSNDNNNS